MSESSRLVTDSAGNRTLNGSRPQGISIS